MFWCKGHRVKEDFVVGICDEELLGKKIGKELKIEVGSSFYGEKLINEKEAVELMEKSTVCNLLGKKIVRLALEKKFITEENVMFIDDIPHAQFIK